MYTEFGDDTVAGMHAHPPEMWTEEFQADMIEMYIRVLEQVPYVFGAPPGPSPTSAHHKASCGSER